MGVAAGKWLLEETEAPKCFDSMRMLPDAVIFGLQIVCRKVGYLF